MTDFKAPPPPPPQNFVPSESAPVGAEEKVEERPVEAVEQPQAVEAKASDIAGQAQQNLNNLQNKFNSLQEPKKLFLVAACMFFVGMIFGALVFGGSEEVVQMPQGLTGVVSNPDIKGSVKRCGRQESRTQACVLYIMNSYGYDKVAGDFFDQAVKLTDRRDFQIRQDNMHYTNTVIHPGEFAQIYIPAIN